MIQNKCKTNGAGAKGGLFMAHYKTIKDTRLLPCPFCGSDAAIWYFSADEKLKAKEAYYVGCTNEECGCEMEHQGGWKSQEEALERWNERA